MPGFSNYKAIQSANFQNLGARFAFFLNSAALQSRWKDPYVTMGQEDSSSRPNHGRFENTRWSVILEAMESRAPGAPHALAKLCESYWQPLYAFARRRGHATEAAQDLVQGFFEHLLASRGLATVDRSKGRFRSFLLASFQNFVSTETRRERAEKRGGRAELIRLDWRDAEARLGFEPEDKLTAEALYDAKWALLLLRRATERLEEEQVAAGKAEIFRTLKGFLGSELHAQAQLTYKEAAHALGIGEARVTTLIHRLRQRHMQLVREEVESTVLDPKDVNAELHGLCEALVQAEGRIRM